MRAVLISEALVQQDSIETLYQNGNSLEQIAGYYYYYYSTFRTPGWARTCLIKIAVPKRLEFY